jgi:hypothetical protein
MLADVVFHKNLRQCERFLYGLYGLYGKNGKNPDCSLAAERHHTCACGRSFVHVHDDVEGCYWALRDRNRGQP